MSQQEFFSGSQGKNERELNHEEDAELYEQPYKAKPSKTRDMPKSEHPSTYEDSIPPYSYRAQDKVSYMQQPAYPERRVQTRQQRQQVPAWARPQHNAWPILRWIVFILLGLVLIKSLPLIIVIVVALIGVAAFAILLPFLILLGILLALAAMVLLVLAVLGVPLSPRRWRGGW